MGESGHSPALVGKHFIMNYYTILHDEPLSLYKFYKDDSVYSFGTEGEPLSPESTVTGQSNINDKIASLGFKKCKVHLSVVDAQPTLGGGVLLMVKGTITNDGTSRKFVQTFLLAQQPSGYYVRNDILRYLADEESAKTTTSAVHTQAPEAVPTPVAEKPKEVAPAVEAKSAEPIEQAAQSAPAAPVPESAQEETKPQAEPELPSQPPTPVAAVPVAAVEQPKETPAPTPVAAVPVAATAPVAATPVPAATTAPAASAPTTGGKPSPAVKPARGGQAGRGKGKEDKTRASAPAAAAPSAEAPAAAATAAPAAAPKESAPADGSWAALAARKKDVPVTPLAAVARHVLPKAAPKKPAPTAAAAPATTAAAAATTTTTTEDASASPATPKEETAAAAAAAPEQAASAVEGEKPVSEPNSIYVSNLPFAAKRSQVVDAFKGFGKIASVSMQNDKGYAFIEYETVEAAHHAIKLATENPISMDGRVLRVEERKTKRGGSGGSGRKLLGSGRSERGAGSDRAPRPPRPDGRERPATGSPRPNGSDRRDRGDRERREKRPTGTGSPAPGRGPAAGGAAASSSGGVPRRAAPASATPPPFGGAATKKP
jgi:hypothetical protein